MNNVIKYIVINDRISNLPEDATKLLFLYNNKNEKKLLWLNIAWSPLPYNIQQKIVYVYRSKSWCDLKMYEIMTDNYIGIIRKTYKDLYDKTFIKFLFDLNYLSTEILSLFKVETKFFQINPGIVLDCNKYYKLHRYEINKINETRNESLISYIKISENLDKRITKKLGYFVRELVKIENEWWLITTGYNDKIDEDRESEKIIHWIFAEVI